VYYSLVDNEEGAPARFYTLRLPLDRAVLGKPIILGVTILRDSEGRPFTAANFDGEGIAVTSRSELFVSSETEPSIRRFSLDGRLLKELPISRKFLLEPEGWSQLNGTFESLSVSPEGRSLFTATEEPLTPDGRDSGGRERIRLLRYEIRDTGDFEPSEEFYYLTESTKGPADLVAVSEEELLVLEHDNRIFWVSLKEADDVSSVASLAAPGFTPLDKELLADPADCVLGGAESTGLRNNPPLGNLESLSLGPTLPDGRRALLLQSDDAFDPRRATRIIALAVGLQRPSSGSEAGACRSAGSEATIVSGV
jgi:hypothetical protein